MLEWLEQPGYGAEGQGFESWLGRWKTIPLNTAVNARLFQIRER